MARPPEVAGGNRLAAIAAAWTAAAALLAPAVSHAGHVFTEVVIAGAIWRYLSGDCATDTNPAIAFVSDTLLATSPTASQPHSVFTIPQGINSSGVTTRAAAKSTAPPTCAPR